MLKTVRFIGVLAFALFPFSDAMPQSGDAGEGGKPPAEGRPSRKERATSPLAGVLKYRTPVNELMIYLVGYHPKKDDPKHQMEAHHYCRQVNADLTQCTLFDGNTKTANLIGIEYIISEKAFENLPAKEQAYWHPHNYEILSGQLIAPGVPEVAEKLAMKEKMNTYGKTWHTWDTMNFGGSKLGANIPLGDPMLMWSFNADGEANPGLIESRDVIFKMKTADRRKARQDLTEDARPQEGVDALKKYFPDRMKPVGVEDKKVSTR